MIIEVNESTVQQALAMPDSRKKLWKVNHLLVNCVFMDELWHVLDAEAKRLQSAGYTREQVKN